MIGGPVEGAPPDVATKVVVLWAADTGMGDVTYKFGEGSLEGATFSATLPGPLPLEATLGGVLGVGLAVLVRADLDIPEGPVLFDVTPEILGAASFDAVIWRPDETPIPDVQWPNDFPAGYACGDCVPMEMSFDAFTPGACDDLVMHVPFDDLTPLCDWT